MRSVEFTVFGQCYSLKNSKMLARGRTIKHTKARQFEKDFAIQVPRKCKLGLGSKKQFLSLTVIVYYPSWRQDVDIEIVKDQLQKAGVVSNDRWIRVEHIEALRIDPKHPRVEIMISEIPL